MCYFFFFNDTATTEIYTLSLHDALPISVDGDLAVVQVGRGGHLGPLRDVGVRSDERRDRQRAGDVDQQLGGGLRSEEHTSELQSRQYLVCRLLLEKKKNIIQSKHYI